MCIFAAKPKDVAPEFVEVFKDTVHSGMHTYVLHISLNLADRNAFAYIEPTLNYRRVSGQVVYIPALS